MPSPRILGAAFVAAAILAAPAMALGATQDTMTPQTPQDPGLMSNGAAPVAPSTAPTAATAPTGAAADTSSMTPDTAASPDQAAAANATDPAIVTNGPIPDTRANRAKYGAPMSNAGKRTAPAGN